MIVRQPKVERDGRERVDERVDVSSVKAAPRCASKDGDPQTPASEIQAAAFEDVKQ